MRKPLWHHHLCVLDNGLGDRRPSFALILGFAEVAVWSEPGRERHRKPHASTVSMTLTGVAENPMNTLSNSPTKASPLLPTVCCFELLEALEKHDGPMAYRELPEHLRDPDLIDVCWYHSVICYLSRYKGRGGYLGSGTWCENLSAVKRDTGANNLEVYLYLEMTGSGHALLVEHRLLQRDYEEQEKAPAAKQLTDLIGPETASGVFAVSEVQLKLMIRQQVKAEAKTGLTDDIFVAAYRQHGSVRKAAAFLSQQTGRHVSKDQVHCALKRSGGIQAVLNAEDSDSIQRTVASQRRDRRRKFASPTQPPDIK